MEWNRTVDEARVAGVPEVDIVAMKKDFVSSEVKKSIKVDGYHPDRLGEIIRKAIGTLIEKIGKFKLPEKSCKHLEEYKAQNPDEEHPTDKESVISKLKSYQAETKTTARKDSKKQKKKETE